MWPALAPRQQQVGSIYVMPAEAVGSWGACSMPAVLLFVAEAACERTIAEPDLIFNAECGDVHDLQLIKNTSKLDLRRVQSSKSSQPRCGPDVPAAQRPSLPADQASASISDIC